MERTEGFQELKPSFFYFGFWVLDSGFKLPAALADGYEAVSPAALAEIGAKAPIDPSPNRWLKPTAI